MKLRKMTNLIIRWLLSIAIIMMSINWSSFTITAYANEEYNFDAKDVLLFSGEGELTRDEVQTQAYKDENIGKKIARIEGYSSIGEGAFRGQEFEIVIIGDSVNAIRDEAFESIRNCKYIVLPNLLTCIEGTTAFWGARCIVYSGYLDNPYNWGAPIRCDKIVDDFCLSSDGRLLSGYVGDSTSITIPCGVDSIDDGAFAKSYLQEIVIPAYVEFLGDGLFKECFNLDCVKFEDISNLELNVNPFMDTPNNVCFDIEKTDEVSKIESLYDLILSDTNCRVRVHPMYYDEVSETCDVDKLPLPEPLPDELFEYDLDSDMYVLTVNDENKAAIAEYKDIRILANHKLIVDTDLEISGDLYVDFFGAITVNKGCSVRAYYVELSDIASIKLGDKDSLSGLGIDAADVRVKHTGDPELYVLDPDDIDDTEFLKENGLLVYKDGPDCGINMNSDGTCASEDGEYTFGEVYYEIYTNPEDEVPAYTGLLQEDFATVDLDPTKFKAGSRIDFVVKSYYGKVLQTNGVRFPNNKNYISTQEEEAKAATSDGCKCSYILTEDPDRYLSVSVQFVSPDELLTDATFAWSYDELVQQYDFDTYVSHGVIEVVSAHNDGEPLFNSHNPDIAPYWSEPGENVAMSDEKGNRWYEQQGRFPIGTELIVRLIPDRGYQLTKFTISNIESSTTAVDGVNEYTFNLSRPDHYHLCAVFTPVEDKVDILTASGITGGSVTFDDFEVDNGTMVLNVSDATPDAEERSAFETMADNKGYEVAKCLNLESEQRFYKGVENAAREQCWIVEKSELDSPADITLEVSGLESEDVVVLHNHNGVYEEIPATYENGQLSFSSQSFSDFAIATKKSGGSGDRDLTLTPNATIKFDGEPIEEGIDFTLEGKVDNDTVSYSYRLKSAGETAVFTPGLPVNAGVYEVKAEIDENVANCLKPISTSAEVTIVKGDIEAQQLKDYEKEYLYCDECEWEEIDLTKLVPINAGEATFAIKDKSYTGADTVSGCSIKDGKLIYNVSKMAAFADNTSTTISITVTSENYNDYIQKIVITRTKCNHPEDKIERKTKLLPECETAGEDIRVCNRCGETIETGIEVPALGHDYHGGICTREGCGVVSFELCNDISVSAESIHYDGNTHVPTVTVSYKGETLTKDTDYKLTVESKTEVGEYELTVTGINKYRGLIRKKWSIVPQRGLWCADIPDQVYTGTAIKPEIEVYNDGIKLVAGKDYTISYKNNIKVAAKDAVNTNKVSIAPSVTITGKGNYADKKTVNFAIVRRSIDTANVDDITVAKTNKDIKITPNVILNGKKLKAGTDYVVSTTPNVEGAIASYKEAGTYNLHVVGKGNYTGSVPFSFTITESTLASKVTIAKIIDQKYDAGNEVKPIVKITHNKKDVTDKFDVTYDNNKEIGTATVKITAKADSGFAGSKTTTFKITGTQIKGAKLGIDGKTKIPAVTYSGRAYEPELDLYVGIVSLQKDKDYTVTYDKNVNVGTGVAIVTGKGAYTGTKKFTFKINKYDATKDEGGLIKITDADHNSNIKLAYEKGGVAPKPIVKMGESVLVEKKDYTLKYANNTAVANKDAVNKSGKSIAPTITIEFKGNYSGKKTVAFEITKKDISKCTLSLADKAESTKANEWKQTAAIIVDTNGKKLNAGTDYNKQFNYYSNEECTSEISEATLPAQTTVYVKVEGINNYAGTYIKGSYRISKTNISSTKQSIATFEYTGSPICPAASDITVTIGKGNNVTTLRPDIDYEVLVNSYTNNTNKGTATVTIRGKGDYYGTQIVKYKIVNKILWWN